MARAAQIALAAALAAGLLACEAVRRRRFPWRERFAGAFGAAYVAFATRLGATFIKVGQIASTRADLLPPALIGELALLRDQVPPFPFAIVRDTVETALGRPLDAVFAAFAPEPVAAASVAQVHRAVLRDGGQVVAVKVRRPDVLDKVRLDRAILLAAGGLLERLFPSLRLVSLREALATFCAAVEAQIHLAGEARNNARFTRAFAGDPTSRFPASYRTSRPTRCS